jgi:hypothetical protein
MKRFILLAALGLLATDALAATPVMRQNPNGMTCESVQGMIKQHGKVVLHWPSEKKPDMTMYNMYVADSTHCVGQGVIGGTTVATSDNPKCKVSYCASNTGKGSVKGGKK